MFDYDKWQEIFGTIRKNKLRTFLTILGIGWGIFMIIVLLGMGNAFQEGVQTQFGGWATNSGFLWSQKTTISYAGFKPGRYTRFTNDDTGILLSRVKELKYLAPRNQLGGWRGSNNIFRNDKTGAFTVVGDMPDFNKIKIQTIEEGRFINKKDIDEKRKVAVIGMNVKDVLFEAEEDPIGKYISINKVNFRVVGIIKPIKNDREGEDQNTVHVPFSTFQNSFNFGNRIGWFAYTVKDQYSAEEVETKLLNTLKAQHDIHPLDEDAIGHFNLQKEYTKFNGLFSGLRYFTWFVGISTLFAGILGVSNIMLIIVKERTKEIGIRKSLGATPISIVSLIIQESIFLTFSGGYIFFIIGLLLLEVAGMAMPSDGLFAPPTVSPVVAISALGILILGGVIASILPASKAAAISPIEAIRTDK